VPALLAAVVVFVTSGAVLVLEILAGRLLAPYVGVTLETFTGIIGVVLAGIALGTWLGGWLADRYHPARLLPLSLVGGGATAVLAVPIIRWLGSAGTGASPATVVVLATMGFFVPTAILSAASPLVIKLQLRDLAQTGQVVGRLSAVGTVGSLVGVFTTGFVLIAAFPTTPVIVVLGGTLVAMGVALWWYLGRLDRRRRAEQLADPGDGARPDGGVSAAGDGRVVLAATGFAVLAGGLAMTVSGPCEVESAYFCARVVPDEQRLSGRTLVLDTLSHSYVDLDDPTYLRFGYVQVLGDVADVIAPPGEPIDVVHVGGGGFTMPRYVEATRPGSDNVVFELDPEMVQLAQDRLGLVLTDELRAVTGDARVNLRRLDDGVADLVIGDAFGGLAVPWHLATVEFAREVQRVLRPDGIYALNVIDHPPSRLLSAEVATLRSVFDHVALVAPPARIALERGGNVVILASDSPLPEHAVAERISARDGPDVVVGSPGELDRVVGDEAVLTDEFAPVDQLITTRR
jgi:MFS family permease/SAM-dependent methyltransferase